MRLCHLTAVLFLSAFPALTAQGRVWIVDSANGAGTNFTDLPPAEAAAAPGDVLLVRAGTYTGFTTRKGLAVLGVPNQTIVQADLLTGFIIENLPAAQTFSADGLSLQPSFGSVASLLVRNCAGAVHLQRLEGRPAAQPLGSEAQVSARDSALVTLRECGRTGVPFSVVADACDVSIVESRISGAGALSDPRAGQRSASAALRVSRGGRVWLADVPLRGGAGVSVWPHVGMFLPSEPGAILDGGQLVVASAAAPDKTIAAGTGATPSLPVSAVAGIGTLLVDPSIVLTPFSTAPPIAPGVVATVADVAGLTAVGNTLGGVATISLRSRPNDPMLIAAGLPTPALPLPFGPLFLAPNLLVFLAFGAQNGSGSTSLSLPLPGNGALLGLGLGLQAASGFGVTLTNPAVLVLR